ncbi:MAG TPA: hypothetical protein VG889_00325 [Rhizomicrobium sp.]|nr:hypothetical protein [Rhizomicrobium sp.]
MAALALQPVAGSAQDVRIKAFPIVKTELYHDVSPTLRSVAGHKAKSILKPDANGIVEIGPDDENGEREHRPAGDGPFHPDGALQSKLPHGDAERAGGANFEGLSNQDNFNVLGFRVNPPDPVGAVGPNHYVQMVNVTMAVYDKTGTQLMPATALGALWDGFAVGDCSLNAGDAIVLYDRYNDRWILSQFTTAETDGSYYNCVAVSKTGDPTGAYYRYAFTTAQNFPDYPKYGIWNGTYVITTREFGDDGSYGIGVYALEAAKMLKGKANARVVAFFLDGDDPGVLPLIGDGLLPAYADGETAPKAKAPIPLVGTQDNGGGYGATSDALNIFELAVNWKDTSTASLDLKKQLPVASFDSIYPCGGDGRDCLPQPGVGSTAFLDILSYRQRPTWRLAYRVFDKYETMVTNQSVEASASHAGVRWYEIRRKHGDYSLFQQGTYAPDDGIHRWMGSAAMDHKGNIALGFSVVNGTTQKPSVRYTGRKKSDPLGQMSIAETQLITGDGVQTSTNSRWGDYTSLNMDPVDDCTFWYTNEYYTQAGQTGSPVGWQTRIASFKLPKCH